MNIAEKLITIAENEPKVFGAGYDNGSAENRNYINNTFSNVLKGTKVGKLVSVNDVSPIEHNLKVKLTSDTVKDFSSVEVYQQGKNIMPRVAWETSTNNGLTYVRNNDGTITLSGEPNVATATLVLNTAANTDFSFLKPNTNYALSIEGFPINLCLQTKKSSGGASYYSYGTANFPETETPDRLFIQIKQSQHPVLENVVLKFQIEEGTVATEYVPPIVKTITANVDGTVEGFTSLPTMLFKTNDSKNVKINLEYNRDINTLNKPKQFEKVYDGIIQDVTFDKPYTELYVKYVTTMGYEADVSVKLDDGRMPMAYFWGAEYQWYHLKLNGGSWETETNSGSDYMPLAEPEFYLGAKGITEFLILPLGDVDNTTDTLTIYAR